ncbi:MAG: TIGR00289 family protein [Legionellales bacterium]|nr:TIGR00289 family protein [Legionellales bacterium]|tara:strand:- start:1283 stop:1939 length:657 start_codon:yes stop_codon:yes gene_type:complete
MRIAVLSSGGKDSSAAWWWAQCRGWDVVALVTVHIQDGDSHMFQVPSTQWVEHQALAAGVKWNCVEASGTVDDEISRLEETLSDLKLDAIVSGALRSDFQKVKLENMAHRLGIHSFSPLWHQDPFEHLHGMIENGFKIMINSVSCEGLDGEWLGRILDLENVQQLKFLSEKYRFNVDGEGGEYETFVVGGPHLPRTLEVEGTASFDSVRGVFTITKIH